MASAGLLAPDEDLVRAFLGGRALIVEAFEVAARAHAEQSRAEPNGRVPYLLHPFRVFTRLVSWGVEDEVSLAAALLHDTVEDNPRGVIQAATPPFRNWVPRGDRPRRREPLMLSTRERAFESLHARFGADVERVVRGLTNPERGEYLPHVAEATLDAQVLVVKTGDVYDNALSLTPTHPRFAKLSARYAPLYPLLSERWRQDLAAQSLTPAWESIVERLSAGPAHAPRT
jgi:hypothetical protein